MWAGSLPSYFRSLKRLNGVDSCWIALFNFILVVTKQHRNTHAHRLCIHESCYLTSTNDFFDFHLSLSLSFSSPSSRATCAYRSRCVDCIASVLISYVNFRKNKHGSNTSISATTCFLLMRRVLLFHYTGYIRIARKQPVWAGSLPSYFTSLKTLNGVDSCWIALFNFILVVTKQHRNTHAHRLCIHESCYLTSTNDFFDFHLPLSPSLFFRLLPERHVHIDLTV